MKDQVKKQKNMASKTKKNYAHEVFFVSVIVLCVVLVSVVFFLTQQYNEVLNEQVEDRVLLNSTLVVESFNERLNNARYQSVTMAEKIAINTDHAAFVSDCLDAVSATDNLGRILYCKDGVVYSTDEVEFLCDKQAEILSVQGTATVLGILYDSVSVMDRFAVCVPLENHPVAQSLVFLYTTGTVKGLAADIDGDLLQQASFLSLCRRNGVSLEILQNQDMLLENNTNVISGLQKIALKEDADTLSRILSSNENGTFFVNVKGLPHIVSVARSGLCPELCFVSLYNCQQMYSIGYDYIGVILTSIVIVVLLLLVFAIYFIFSNHNLNKKMSNFGTKNEQLKCLSRIGFEREVTKTLDRYKGSKFAVVSLGIRRFEYITKTAGQESALDLLKQISTIINSNLKLGEIYGYEANGEFLALMQYGEYEALDRRLHQFYHVVHTRLSTDQYTVKFNFGICPITPGGSVSSADIISNAKLAMDSSGLEKLGGNYTVYNETLRDNYLKISDLEVKTEQGLRNQEFEIFYQPKYNIEHDRIDGCEALVRWHDLESDSYRVPDSFLPALEANGFISRLDHYVFTQVCKFVHKRANSGIPIVPVSVNVSRVTMLEDDFVDFYKKIKEQYQIPNKFITLEFTESVAFENYTYLTDLMKSLHESGFLCSLDDFGTGYSSYNMLKSLQVDEVKLDRFFIEDCLGNPRAKTIVESVTELGNKLKIKVTQEGVEDEQTFNYIKKIGCKVLQGYYYSKPISEKQFEEFMEAHLR